MEMLLVNDRGAARRAVSVECHVVRERDFVLLGERAVDLSTDGMLLLSEVPVLTGEDVIVALRLPGTDTWIDALATVTRTVHGRRRTDRGRAIGLRFAPLDTESHLLVRCALRRFPPTVPVRAPRIDYAATACMIALT
ncbi:MAG: PilZ domain-containing protein [Polyangiaceae bacterium]|nr:PilZ domain-containing protein [Polyangiaceae bacterium]